MRPRILRIIEVIWFCLLLTLVFRSSTLLYTDQAARVRRFTRTVEFDYFNWTINAFGIKWLQASLNSPYVFSETARHQMVIDYMGLTDRIIELENQLNVIYVNPAIADPQSSAAGLRKELNELYARQKPLAALTEAVLQEQLSLVLADLDLVSGGQPIPPVLFHISPLPYQLVVSPRSVIQAEVDVSLVPDINVEQHAALEAEVDKALNVSSLVVPVGGIGAYPTMVMRTTALDWLLNVIAHEWTHNYLTLRPLGMNYYASPELRTMNETTASIVGNEVSLLILQRFYPERLAGAYYTDAPINLPAYHGDPNDIPRPIFDFRAEMYETRLTVDALLEDGKIEEAEAYMEARRTLFWENGFSIRKINQAYFAFYGSYADIPGGAAGEDPIGPAVRTLRKQSDSLTAFIRRIASMTSFEELQAAISP